LNTGGGAAGTFSQVAVGDTPAKACGSNQVIVHLSGGDITAVRSAGGSGLAGGTDNGAASLSLDSSGCSDGGVLKWSAATSTWTCGTDNNTIYNGSNFALSDQTCSGSNTFAYGIDGGGSLECQAVALREKTVETDGTIGGTSCAPWGHIGGVEFCSTSTTPSLDLFATCPSDYPHAVAGGYQTGIGVSQSDALFVYDDNPTFGGTIGSPADGWHARFVLYSGGASYSVKVYAVCAQVP
jgi:hypothetical protein